LSYVIKRIQYDSVIAHDDSDHRDNLNDLDDDDDDDHHHDGDIVMIIMMMLFKYYIIFIYYASFI